MDSKTADDEQRRSGSDSGSPTVRPGSAPESGELEMADGERLFDIFRKAADGSCVWVESVKGFDEARVRVRQLHRVESLAHSEYKIFDSRTGQFLEIQEKTA